MTTNVVGEPIAFCLVGRRASALEIEAVVTVCLTTAAQCEDLPISDPLILYAHYHKWKRTLGIDFSCTGNVMWGKQD
jgi:hypothetical protein